MSDSASHRQRSLQHSVRDGVAFSVMSGAGETYISAYAVFLRASAQEIAWLAALPPLLGSWMQLVSAWLGARGLARKRLILAGALAQGLIWLPLALLPLVAGAGAVPVLIACVVFYHACSNLIQPQWSSLMRDLVPQRRRGRFFAGRTRAASLTAFIALVGAGGILAWFNRAGMEWLGFPAIFAVAVLARLISVYHLGRMHDPRPVERRERAPMLAGMWRSFGTLRGSRFLHFSLFFAGMQGAVAVASPFFTLFMLRDLNFTYLQFTASTAMAVVMQFLTLNAWGRISDAFGNRLVLAATGWIIPFVPALWLVSTDFRYLLAVQALGGLAWAGFTLSAGNFLYDLLPGRRLARDMAVHNMLGSLGIFAGALTGGWLATHLPTAVDLAGLRLEWDYVFYGVFALSAAARLTVAIVFLPRLREVRPVRPLSFGGLIFRVTRIHALSGLSFDIVGAKEKKP